MATPLAVFFEHMKPFLERRVGVEETVRLLGPSASGDARLALYPELVRRQKRGILDHFFASARAVCVAHHPQLWDNLAEAYILEVAPDHWEPNHYAKRMYSFLEARQQTKTPVPAAVLELVDFAWIRYAAMLAAHPTGFAASGSALGQALFVRSYSHEIPNFALAVEGGDRAVGSRPEPASCTVLICRSRHTQRLEIVRPSLAALLALRRRDAPEAPLSLAPGISYSDVVREDQALVDLGVLAPLPTLQPRDGHSP